MATPSEAVAAARKPKMIPFRVQRSNLSVRATFKTHFWSLFHDIPRFYSSLLAAVSDFGVTPNAIKTDVGDGSLGAYNVNFWMFDFRASVHIRLERVDIQFNNMSTGDVDQIDRAFVKLIGALQSSLPDFAISGYGVEIGLHGKLLEVETPAYLASFVPAPPALPGSPLGSAVLFYYGEHGAATARTISADLSGQISNGLYVSLNVVYNDTVKPEALRAEVEAYGAAALRALGLTTDGTYSNGIGKGI